MGCPLLCRQEIDECKKKILVAGALVKGFTQDSKQHIASKFFTFVRDDMVYSACFFPLLPLLCGTAKCVLQPLC